MSLHELTAKLRSGYLGNATMDKVIREYLEEKVKEMEGSWYPKIPIRKILGLEDKPKGESVEKVWCSHILFSKERGNFEINDGNPPSYKVYWDYCPICGAKRPEEPKKKRMAQILEDSYCCGTPLKQIFEVEAEAALQAVIECYERWQTLHSGGPDSFQDYLNQELGNEPLRD